MIKVTKSISQLESILETIIRKESFVVVNGVTLSSITNIDIDYDPNEDTETMYFNGQGVSRGYMQFKEDDTIQIDTTRSEADIIYITKEKQVSFMKY